MTIETIIDVKNFLNDVEVAMNQNEITPDEAITKVHAKNDIVVKKFGMYLDNDLVRNGVINTHLAKKFSSNLSAKANWFEIYRPWGTTKDLVRPVDKFAVSVAIDQMTLAISLGDYKETEQMYDMEKYGNKYADLADC